jgi:hypothetical protein
MFKRAIKFWICNTGHIKNVPYFPQCILVFNILVKFFVIICEVQVMYDAQETLWCHSSGGRKVWKTVLSLSNSSWVCHVCCGPFVQWLLQTETFWNLLHLDMDLVFCHSCPNIDGSILLVSVTSRSIKDVKYSMKMLRGAESSLYVMFHSASCFYHHP